jgi:uncharacterized protein (TIGR02588 family)
MSPEAEDRDDDRSRPARTPAEWVSFAVSCLVLGVVVILIVQQPQSDDGPAAPVASVAGEAERVPGGFHVPVEVRNEGKAAAADVQVTAELTIVGETSEADQVVPFLGAEEAQDLVFVFPDDPADGDLTVQVAAFAVP